MEEVKDNVQRPYKGMVTDVHPSDQPKETYRYALNAINKTEVGHANFLSMENAITQCTSFPMGTTMLSAIYMVDDTIAVFLTDGVYDYIGTVNNQFVFKLFVKTQVLNLSKQHRIEGTFRMRRNSQRIIYWVDGYNKPRLFNFDRPSDFYTIEYETFLETHSINETYNSEKWSDIKFDLIKTYTTIPTFDDVEILNSGNIPSGSYSISIQLIDENLSPTEWINTCNPVNIFVDSLDLEYTKIRGSRNSTSSSQNFQNASKSIRWTIGNLDDNFSFYRVAVLASNNNDGEVNKVLVSGLIPINDSTFVYSGNDASFTETSLEDIKKSKTDISSAKYIEQLENRLILAGIKGKQIDWCRIQKYASKIKSNISLKKTPIDDINAEGSPKNPTSSFTLTGYMWGEVYSFGIVYVFNDGYESPAYHIPGRISNAYNGMDYYECDDSYYPAIHNCSDNYWGNNGYDGAALLGQKIRHHKFPERNTNLISEEVNNVAQPDNSKVEISFNFSGSLANTADLHYVARVVVENSTGIIDTVDVIVDSPYADNDPLYVGTYSGDIPSISSVTWIGDQPNMGSYEVVVSADAAYKSVKNTSTDLCGIRFSNIERPHPDVIGFKIVRNERTEDDKIIVDNVLLGPLTSEQNNSTNPYHTFGLLAPDTDDANKSKSGLYIFSPEHQFGNKKINFDEIKITGAYTRSSKFVPSNTDGEMGNGMYLQDVRPGTTFNSSYNKGEDPDGFDLQVLYRVSDMQYSTATGINIPTKDRVLYLSAAGNISIDDKIFFNASSDNKIMIVTFDADHLLPDNLFTSNSSPRILYGSLIRNNTTAYSDFINRTYYPETNNVVLFEDNEITDSGSIFNGDSYVCPMVINSSTYYDTKFGDFPKKSRVWKIVLGSVLAVAGIVLMLIPGTQIAGAALIETAITVMAVAYGVSMLTSGIEFETLKNMIDQHYEAGLKITIQDNDNVDANYKNGTVADDKFCWFTDRIQNMYFESSINIGLRSGTTVSVSDFINAPAAQLSNSTSNSNTANKESYEVYLSNKYTVVDREQNSGRLYMGYANAEFYDINKDYLRKNHEKPKYHLPIEYDCCSIKIENYNNRIFYSEQSFQEERIDNFRNFLTNNYSDIEGQFGEITGIFRFNNTLYIHTTESLLVLPQNMQERVNQELVTFIGTGDFFAISPRKIMDGEKGAFGSSDTKATVVTRNGVFFVNTKDGIPYLITDRPTDISEGNSIWFKENLKIKLHDYIKSIPYSYYNNAVISYAEDIYNPLDNTEVGVHAVYDSILNRIIVTKLDYKPLFNINLYSTQTTPIGKFRFNPDDNSFYCGTVNGDKKLEYTDKNYFENLSWTMSYSFDTRSWISYHSYLPAMYIATPSKLYSPNSSNLFVHHTKGLFCDFYGIRYKHIIEYVSVSNPITVRTWEHIGIQAIVRKYISELRDYIEVNNIFFDSVILSNSRQCSGQQSIIVDSVDNFGIDYMGYQVKNVQSQILAKKIEQTWFINNLRNYVFDYTKPMFLKTWSSLKNLYPIDKVVNEAVINNSMSWYEVENFRDKYLVIRLIFSNFGNGDIQITTNYSFENEQNSLT